MSLPPERHGCQTLGCVPFLQAASYRLHVRLSNAATGRATRSSANGGVFRGKASEASEASENEIRRAVWDDARRASGASDRDAGGGLVRSGGLADRPSPGPTTAERHEPAT